MKQNIPKSIKGKIENYKQACPKWAEHFDIWIVTLGKNMWIEKPAEKWVQMGKKC